MNETSFGRVYAGSNGNYYTERQLERNLRSGCWTPCLRQRNPARRLVETREGNLLLVGVVSHPPPWIEIRISKGGARIVDTRVPLPE
ncbi:hypothetical protein BB347_16775 (plasmid) [Natronorubrum daqingense]|nr:hypothetical protein BB347_16775 [Natronorubrum daqingense]